MTTIELKDSETAIVIDKDSHVSVYIPNLDSNEDTECPANTILAAALSKAIEDKDPHITAIIGKFLKLVTPEEYNMP